MLRYQYTDSTGNRYAKFASDSDAKRWFRRLKRDTHSDHAALIVWECGIPVQIASWTYFATSRRTKCGFLDRT